jgi:peptidyl-prolyl cis-trans isomerase B (cyclophilin B)
MSFVELQTSQGNIVIQLFEDTPQHRDNFLKLVKEGFYDSLLFHRVIKEFMIQGGDPDSKQAGPSQPLGMGGPGYTIPAEFVPTHRHFKGALAAARQGDNVNPKKASSGSQFYIVQGKPVDDAFLSKIEQFRKFQYTEEEKKRYMTEGGTPHLDGEYTVFGQVVEGMDVIDKIAAQPCNNMDRPKEDIRILKAKAIKR